MAPDTDLKVLAPLVNTTDQGEVKFANRVRPLVYLQKTVPPRFIIGVSETVQRRLQPPGFSLHALDQTDSMALWVKVHY